MLAQIAQVLGLQGVSVKSVVQKGLRTEQRPAGTPVPAGGQSRLVLVVHPVLESRFFGAVQLIAAKDFVTSPPRAIRVIDEEFTA